MTTTIHHRPRKSVPFVSIASWRLDYPNFTELIMGHPDLREIHPELSQARIYPGAHLNSITSQQQQTKIGITQQQQPPELGISNKCFALKPSEAFLAHLKQTQNNNNNDNDDKKRPSPATRIISDFNNDQDQNGQQSPFLCTVWPLFKEDNTRDQQLFLMSDVVIVWVNSDRDKKRTLQVIQNRILPLLIVATSRSGIEAEVNPLKCVLLDASDNLAPDPFIVELCGKLNAQQRRLNIFFSAQKFTHRYSGVKVIPKDGLSPLEVILMQLEQDHETFLKMRSDTESKDNSNKDKNDQDQEEQTDNDSKKNVKKQKQQEHENHSFATTKEATELRTFSVMGLDLVQFYDSKKHQEYSQSESYFSIFVQCHQQETVDFYLTQAQAQSQQRRNTNQDDNQDEPTKKLSTPSTITITAARCPQEAICDIIKVEQVYQGTRMLKLLLSPRSPRLFSAFREVIFTNHPESGPSHAQRQYEKRYGGVFSTGSVWGRCFTEAPETKTMNHSRETATATTMLKTTHQRGNDDDDDDDCDETDEHQKNNNNNDHTVPPSTTSTTTPLPNLVGFNFFTHFPSTPQIMIIRVPKLHPRFARGIGGSVTLLGFGGGELHLSDVVAIASPSEQRLMSVPPTPAFGNNKQKEHCVYYACRLPDDCPLYVFERPWCRVLLTASNGLTGNDEYIFVTPCEVLFTWRKFEIMRTLMRNLLGSSSSPSEQSIINFQDDFLTCKNHEEITKRFIHRVFAPAVNNFLASESYELPIAVSEDSTPEENVIKYLFRFPSGLPGSSEDIKSLGQACVRAMMNDLFGDCVFLIDQVMTKPQPISTTSATSETDENIDDSLFLKRQQEHLSKVNNWLNVRKMNRHQQGQLTGAVCVCHFIMILDARIRETWAFIHSASSSSNSSYKQRMNLSGNVFPSERDLNIRSSSKTATATARSNSGNSTNDDDEFVDETDALPKEQQQQDCFGNPASFVTLLMRRLKLLPYNMTPQKISSSSSFLAKLNPLRVPPTPGCISFSLGGGGATTTPTTTNRGNYSTSTASSSSAAPTSSSMCCDPLQELPLVGWNTPDPLDGFESWQLNIVFAVWNRWQLEAAVNQIMFGARFGTGGDPTRLKLGGGATYSVLYQKIEQYLPIAFMSNGMFGPMNLFLPRAAEVVDLIRHGTTATEIASKMRLSTTSSLHHKRQTTGALVKLFEMKNFWIHALRFSTIERFTAVLEAIVQSGILTKRDVCAAIDDNRLEELLHIKSGKFKEEVAKKNELKKEQMIQQQKDQLKKMDEVAEAQIQQMLKFYPAEKHAQVRAEESARLEKKKQKMAADLVQSLSSLDGSKVNFDSSSSSVFSSASPFNSRNTTHNSNKNNSNNNNNSLIRKQITTLLQTPISSLAASLPRSYLLLSDAACTTIDIKTSQGTHDSRFRYHSAENLTRTRQNLMKPFSVPGTDGTCRLTKLAEVMTLEMLCDQRNRLSELPFHFLWRIAKESQN